MACWTQISFLALLAVFLCTASAARSASVDMDDEDTFQERVNARGFHQMVDVRQERLEEAERNVITDKFDQVVNYFKGEDNLFLFEIHFVLAIELHENVSETESGEFSKTVICPNSQSSRRRACDRGKKKSHL